MPLLAGDLFGERVVAGEDLEAVSIRAALGLVWRHERTSRQQHFVVLGQLVLVAHTHLDKRTRLVMNIYLVHFTWFRELLLLLLVWWMS